MFGATLMVLIFARLNFRETKFSRDLIREILHDSRNFAKNKSREISSKSKIAKFAKIYSREISIKSYFREIRDFFLSFWPKSNVSYCYNAGEPSGGEYESFFHKLALLGAIQKGRHCKNANFSPSPLPCHYLSLIWEPSLPPMSLNK